MHPLEISGQEPAHEHRPHATVALSGGHGRGLIDATSVLADASPPPRVARPGVDALASALMTAIQITLAGVRDLGPADWGAPVPENVTVLFTDLVAWTSMASRLGPDAADDLRRRHFSTLASAIAACAGHEVKSLGDGVMAVFPLASAALACAVAMQQGVDRDNCSSGKPVGLRVGLSGGEVMREGTDYFGEPVVEAARLCALAPGGKILAARVVAETAGRRSRHPYRPLGCVELRGLAEPVEVHEVVWEPAPAASVRSPSALAGARGPSCD